MTFLTALPLLLALQRKAGLLRGVLGCRGKPHLHPVPGQAREVPDLDWSVCPLDLLDGPHLQRVRTLDRLAKVSPLQDWPGRYAPWVVEGLLMLRGV